MTPSLSRLKRNWPTFTSNRIVEAIHKTGELKMQPRIAIDCDLKLVALVVMGLLLVIAQAAIHL